MDPLNVLCLLCFPPRRFSSQGRRPQNGSASTGKLNYFSVRCGNRSMRLCRSPLRVREFRDLRM